MSEYKILHTSDIPINELLRVSIFKKHETPYHIRAMEIAGFTAFSNLLNSIIYMHNLINPLKAFTIHTNQFFVYYLYNNENTTFESP